ncbi:hypothetical protein IHE44_0014830 [Lamprotornis superbus]|uniref:Protein Niban n=1 Tax=Lamprotornis superbus TaxID=245042 RepID=A0A835P1X3_9PASS|nr:hypothetical protein IHE44_0014830 [Lamprotornis superbus]
MIHVVTNPFEQGRSIETLGRKSRAAKEPQAQAYLAIPTDYSKLLLQGFVLIQQIIYFLYIHAPWGLNGDTSKYISPQTSKEIHITDHGKTEATIKNFSPHYRRQYAVAFCRHVQEELEQHRHSQSCFLKTRPAGEAGTVLYEAELLHFAEDLKKWKDRYVVIKNDYTVECFETKEAYQKGASPKYHILPAGGKVLTSEEDYNLLSDKHFPDPLGSSEEAAAAFVPLPKEFPVYLWQPFSRHSYYCFQEPGAQRHFSAVLGDCVRHSNHGILQPALHQAALSCSPPSNQQDTWITQDRCQDG